MACTRVGADMRCSHGALLGSAQGIQLAAADSTTWLLHTDTHELVYPWGTPTVRAPSAASVL